VNDIHLTDDERWMRRALELAQEGRGTTTPNPMVGAVVVRDGQCIGEGWHQRAGGPHAERVALDAAGSAASGADLYVTLEPCCFTGRTGPCTEAVIQAGVRRVIVGAGDPNPRVSGQGTAALRAADVEVTEGVLEDDCTRLNAVFNHWITTGKPFVTLKLASTLDGRIATYSGASQWITGPEARAIVHRLRGDADCVMVGSGTAIADDPRLTVRDAPLRGAPPIRAVVDSRLRVPVTSALFSDAPELPLILVTSNTGTDRIQSRRDAGAEVLLVSGHNEHVNLEEMMTGLGSRESRPITSLLVEGGSGLAQALVKANLVQRLHLFLAPSLLGADGLPSLGPLGCDELSEAPRWAIEHVGMVGQDIEVIATPRPLASKES